MTDQEIVQALRCCADHSCSAKCPAFPAGLDCREEMHKEVLALIERLTAENAALREKVSRWISVEEQRPEPGKRVLATDGVFVGEAYRGKSGEWRRYDDCLCWFDVTSQAATHWMPLPVAPKFADLLRGSPDAPAEGGKHE